MHRVCAERALFQRRGRQEGAVGGRPERTEDTQTLTALCAAALVALCIFGGIKWYRYATFNPFADGSIPAVMTDAERVSDAVAYMKETYGTDLFDDAGSYADIGFVKTVLTDVYGYDADYVYALPKRAPRTRATGTFCLGGWATSSMLPGTSWPM
jgi:hypothetical protein